MRIVSSKSQNSNISEKLENKKSVKDSFEKDYDYYQLASIARIIFARFLDIILVSILPLALTLTMGQWDKTRTIWAPILIIAVTFILFYSYFVLITFFWKGLTIGKWIFRIRLVNIEQRLKLSVIFTRELFIIFLPWFIVLILNLVLNLVFDSNLANLFQTGSKSKIAVIIIRVVTTCYLFWYLGLIFGLAFNRDHQILFDRHFHLYLVRINPDQVQKPKAVKKLITRNESHVHLQENQPGNISNEILKEIDEL